MPPPFSARKTERFCTKAFYFLHSCSAFLLAVFFLLTFSTAGRTVSPSPEPILEEQPNGKTIEVFLKGSEFFSWFETGDGYLVTKDSADGSWNYARFCEDRLAVEPIAGATVGKVDPASLPIQPNARPKPALLREHILKQTPTPNPLSPPSAAVENPQP